MNKKLSITSKRRLAAGILAAGTVILLQSCLFRPYWYDEALTLLEFVGQEGYSYIYRHYEIPNNHIVYNCIIMAWIRCWQSLMPIMEGSFRIFSIAMAGLSIWLIASRWPKRFGDIVWPLCISLLLSLPMLIYGTAIRGYILSFLLVLIAIESAVRWRDRGSGIALGIYGLAALLAVGTIPSNILAFAAINLLPDNPLTTRNILTKRRLALAIIPILAFVAFYLPIAGKLLSVIALKEGWSDPVNAIIHLYGAFAISMAPIIIISISAIFISRKRKLNKWRIANTAIIWLIPAMIMIIRQPAPFPRAFFCFWPVWLYTLALSGKHSMTYLRQRCGRNSKRKILGLIILTAAVWGLFMQLKPEITTTMCTPPGVQDDFCNPYYMRPEFEPRPAVGIIGKIFSDGNGRVFISANADFPSIIVYGKINGLPEDMWLYDRPGKKVQTNQIPPILTVIARNHADAENIGRRFGFKTYTIAGDFGFQKVYVLE